MNATTTTIGDAVETSEDAVQVERQIEDALEELDEMLELGELLASRGGGLARARESGPDLRANLQEESLHNFRAAYAKARHALRCARRDLPDVSWLPVAPGGPSEAASAEAGRVTRLRAEDLAGIVENAEQGAGRLRMLVHTDQLEATDVDPIEHNVLEVLGFARSLRAQLEAT